MMIKSGNGPPFSITFLYRRSTTSCMEAKSLRMRDAGSGVRGAQFEVGRTRVLHFRAPRPLSRIPAGYFRAPRPAPRTVDPELPVLRPLHPAVLAHDHRRDGLAALDRGDVEAFDTPRDGRQVEDGAERFERVVVRRDVLVEPRLIRDLRIPGREIEQSSLLAAFWDNQPDAVIGSIRQPGFNHFAFRLTQPNP